MIDFTNWSDVKLREFYDKLLEQFLTKGASLTGGGLGEVNFSFAPEVKLTTRLQIVFAELRRRGITVAPPPAGKTRAVFA